MRPPLALAFTALAALAAAIASATGAPTPLAASSTPASFLLTGGGWGHGVGMSQWGAYGQAKEGRAYDEILRSYYTGVELAPVPESVPKTLRVLVGDALGTVAVSSSAPFRVRDATGRNATLPAEGVTVDPGLELPVGDDGGDEILVGPLLFLPAKGATLAFAGRQYRSNLRVAVVQKRLQVVNVVPLETYLLGVVPGEMPKDWPLEALKAQAVAARTYAVATLVKGRSFDLYSDWRSQLYYGAASEAPGPSRAVKETRGQVILYDGAPITAFYFSSSGGRTASAIDVYGSDVPYLAAVDDPWDAVSPHHVWEPRTFTGASLAKALRIPGAIVDAVTVPGATGAPARVVLTTAAGTRLELKLSEVRSRMALKSTSFRLGTLRLTRTPGPRATPAVTLSGVARNVDRPLLQKLGPAGTWVAGPKLVVGPDGTFSVTVRPPGALTVRLAADGLVGAALTIPAAGAPA
jgi:stage II sporulation protein D